HFIAAGLMGLSQGISFAGASHMKSLLFVIVAALVLVVSVSAQTSLSLWPYYVEVVPERTDGQIYDVAVPLPVMDRASSDLADLRLFDSNNREIPYAIRIRRELDQKQEIPARLFNHG